MWESSLFLCVSLQGAGKKSTVQIESSEFGRRLIMGLDFDLSWEVLMIVNLTSNSLDVLDPSVVRVKLQKHWILRFQ